MKNNKPLGQKAYGSIPHLPNSRLGEGDHSCSDGQARICTEKPRDKNDTIIVQEKLDGSCVSVARLDGRIVPLTRAGYHSDTSRFEQHLMFTKYVMRQQSRFLSILEEGERVVGEWLVQAHGTRYDLPHEPFVPFDIMIKHVRLPFRQFEFRVIREGFITPKLLSYGNPISVKEILKKIEISGHGAIDPVEGAVWRVERNGVVDFLAKYVRKEKEDGKYFPQNNNGEVIWNNYVSVEQVRRLKE